MEQTLYEVCEWLDSYEFLVPGKNIYMDFSNGIYLARILKQHFPEDVDLKDYSVKNCVVQKIANWNVLNENVLSLIDVNLDLPTIAEVAKATPSAIEKVLCEVKLKLEDYCKTREEIRLSKIKRRHERPKVNDLERIDEIVLSIERSSAAEYDSDTEVTKKIAAPSEICDQDKKINTLQDTIINMQFLLERRDEDIQNLSEEVERLSNTSPHVGFMQSFYKESLIQKLMKTITSKAASIRKFRSK